MTTETVPRELIDLHRASNAYVQALREARLELDSERFRGLHHELAMALHPWGGGTPASVGRTIAELLGLA